MDRQKKMKLSLTMLFLLLIMIVSLPAWANEVTGTIQASDPTNDDNTAISNTITNIKNGSGNTVTNYNAVIYGGNQNTAIGFSVQVVNGSNNEVTGCGGLAGDGDGNVAIGVNAQVVDGDNNKLTNYGAFAGHGSYNTAIGRQGTYAGYGNYNTAIGQHTYAGCGSGNTAIGVNAVAGGSDINTAIGYGAQAAAGSSVALGAFSKADRPNSVSVGNSDYNYNRQITNVAPGTYDTDAVNVSQLRNVGDQVYHLSNRVDRLGSIAFAFSALAPMAYDPESPTQISAGMGTYNGTTGFAIGVFHYTHPDVMLNAGIAMSSDNGWEKAARFGATWRIGKKHTQEQTPKSDTVTNDPVAATQPEDNSVMARTKRILDEAYAEEGK